MKLTPLFLNTISRVHVIIRENSADFQNGVIFRSANINNNHIYLQQGGPWVKNSFSQRFSQLEKPLANFSDL